MQTPVLHIISICRHSPQLLATLEAFDQNLVQFANGFETFPLASTDLSAEIFLFVMYSYLLDRIPIYIDILSPLFGC